MLTSIDHVLRQNKRTITDFYQLTINTANAGSASNTMILPFTGPIDFLIDWGDGSSERVSGESATHVYANSGIYTVKISGSGRLFFNNAGDRFKVVGINSILSSLVNAASLLNGCACTGTIPTLPASLTNGYAMFATNQLTGTIPTLPASLTNGDTMFYNNQLSGTIPTLPASLTNGYIMFASNQLSGTIPTLPASLTNGDYMFATNQLTTYSNGSLATTTCSKWTEAFSSNAFTQSSINNMMTDLRSAVTSGFITASSLVFGCSGGTNAAPSGQGLIDKLYLVGLGATITTN
jgi:hypothetical protein